MITQNRYVARITYKVMNKPTNTVRILNCSDSKTAKKLIEQEFNANEKQLIEIKSLRKL